ncbi:MAG: BsuPI-related putative proteinase inhibitor [Gammaproteobacteria bacterium]|jgi:hypothetical protein
MFLRKLLAAVFMLSIIVGCHDASDADTSSDFVVTLRTLDKFGQDATSFVQGENITIVLSIKNVSAETKTLNFGSGEQYDFIAKDANDTIVWRWSMGKLFIAAFTSYDIAPSDTHTVTTTWDQMTPAGVLPVGNYTLEAVDIGISTIPKQDFSII